MKEGLQAKKSGRHIFAEASLLTLMLLSKTETQLSNRIIIAEILNIVKNAKSNLNIQPTPSNSYSESSLSSTCSVPSVSLASI